MQEPLEIRVLGPFEVLVGERQADVVGLKRQALLAMFEKYDLIAGLQVELIERQPVSNGFLERPTLEEDDRPTLNP